MRSLAIMAIALVGVCVGASAQTVPQRATVATPRPIPPVHADPALDPVTVDRLETFRSDRDFARYVAEVAIIRAQRNNRRVSQRFGSRPRMAFQDAAEDVPDCPPDDPGCAEPQESVVVTGTAAAAPVSITNVQTSGVDEGDVVKQIGNFLLVLQDGRIFSVDTGGGRLRLADRIDVYRNADDDDAWYDEMLVEGQRILITAYNYGQDATEISVFKLDTETGRLSRDGSFLISSEDYYDSDNYATRIIGDQLIIYTPYAANDFTQASQRPRVRRWMSEAEMEAQENRGRDPRGGGRDLLDARQIYRPLLRTLSPTVHTITQCQLGQYRPNRAPPCRATAFAGPTRAEMFVAPDAVYLWVGEGWAERYDYDYNNRPVCPTGRASLDGVTPAVVYRLPVDGGAPGGVGLRGQPFNQFSMDETRRTFRILVDVENRHCDRAEGDWTPVSVAFANVPLREFRARLRTIADDRHVAVPSPGEGSVENRFAGDWLVYGGRRRGYGAIPDDDGEAKAPGRPVVVLPVADPARARTVTLDHNVIRIERVGENRMAINGYRDATGLSVSLMQLGQAPRILDTTRLARRFESEGRSHAFNSSIGADGIGLIGVPTVLRPEDAGRWWWSDSEGSDVSFLTVAASGQLGDAGPLVQGLKEPAYGYACEVSCIDWYGNSRPIFTGGRIFALMATEIAEGQLVHGRIREVRRVNLTQRVPPR